MSELLDYLKTRRSIPAATMTGPGPDAETLETILTIGARVPDHGKLAPWRFVLYRGEAAVAAGEALAKMVIAREGDVPAERIEQEKTRFTRSPLVIGVASTAQMHPKIPVWEQELAAGAVCMNLLHAANATGFVGQWLTEWYAFDDEAGAYLGLRPGERWAGFVHIGRPTEPPFERPRPNLADITTEWAPPA